MKYQIQHLEKENKKLKEEIKERQEEVERFKSNAMADADYELKLEEENKKLEEENLLQLAEIRRLRGHLGDYKKLKIENRRMKDTIKDHQFYEEKLEHRIIEFEELLHGE